MRNTVKRVLANYRTSRVMLYGVSLPLLALSVAGIGNSALRILWVMLGFSLIIFLHELGHFLVARACSVKCLAFSLGIGPRMFGWRKGGHFSFGKDPFDPDVKKDIAHKAIEEAEGAAGVADLPQSAVIPPHPKNVGDCDYRVSWLPLGGYVRMLGQDDMDPTKISNDPRAFNKRPIWQRMCIVSAGVIMNLIFAAITFSIIFSPGIGVDFPPAEIGYVAYNSPADKAGIQMGDRIVAIDGKKPIGDLEFTDVIIASALSTGTRPISYDIKRTLPDGTIKDLHFDIQPVPPADGGSGFLTIGVTQMPSLTIAHSQELLDESIALRKKPKSEGGDGDDAAAKSLTQLKSKDLITAVNGTPVHDYVSFYKVMQHSDGQPLALTVKQPEPGATERIVSLQPELEPRMGVDDYPAIFGMGPRTKVLLAPDAGTPAQKAGIAQNDIILSIGDLTLPTRTQFRQIASASPGKPLSIKVLRGNDIKSFTITPKDVDGRGIVGVAIGGDRDDLTVMLHDKSAVTSDLERLTAKNTIKISAIDNKPMKTWNDVYSAVKQKNQGDKVEVAFTSSTLPAASTLTFTVSKELAATLHDQLQYVLNLPVDNKTFTQKADNFFDATLMGVDHTQKFVEQVYMTLRGLFNRTVPMDNLHGIVGIARVGYTVQERGPVWLWYVLALVSVNLAVANFLPLPIVDGGLFLLLIVEKIRGKPLSLKVQSIIQTAGIILLAGLFLYVTYNDIFGPAFAK